MANERMAVLERWDVQIVSGDRRLEGVLCVPPRAQGIVVVAHGRGSGRFSDRNQFVSEALESAGLATLLLDLMDAEETREAGPLLDIPLLAKRLDDAAAWAALQQDTAGLPVGYFGGSTGAAVALRAAVEGRHPVRAVVSRGGRPDLARAILGKVMVPTLLIVGGCDYPCLSMNEEALDELGCAEKAMVVVPGATHLFQEPGALEEVARHAVRWFSRHLCRAVL